MFPATIKQLVTTNCIKINVRIKAIKSASRSDLPDLSPSAFAQTLHNFFNSLSYDLIIAHLLIFGNYLKAIVVPVFNITVSSVEANNSPYNVISSFT